MSAWGGSERIRVPMPDGTYRDYAILELLGAGYSQLQSAQGFGMPPIRIIEQRGPLQHGSTLVDYRYQERVMQVVVSKRLLSQIDLVDHRFDLTDLLRPSREFPAGGGAPSPLVYRKWLPGGKRVQGTDLVLTAGDDEVQSVTGRFVHYGLRVGSQFTISGSTADDGAYTVEDVFHDGRLQLDQNMTNTETGVHWEYTSEPSVRDLYCTLELGPAFDRPDNRDLNGYIEALRFVGNDPFWYGAEQEQAWAVSSGEFDNLVFDYGDAGVDAEDAGAAFGATPGTGRWLFADNYVSDEIDIPYWGHEGAVPVIEITGPAVDLVVSNDDLGSQLSFNYNISAGQVVTIDTLNLTVQDNAGEDLFLYLTGDVSGFIISPDVANNRVNTLTVEFSEADANSEVNLVWRNRYTSV